jgi:hypothetical protein
MSNPSGAGHDGGAHTAGAEGYPLDADSDPVTEVIEIPAALVSDAVSDTAERRYTAPGFDAGSTQIIDRLPDESEPTEIFYASARSRAATPRAIAPRKPERPSWLLPILLALAALAAVAIVAFLLIHRTNSAKTARIGSVRTTIQTFDAAVRNGDLATLRGITCGQTKNSYAGYDDKSWVDAYSKIAETKQYPVVDSIDEVVVNGDHAEANVTSYMAFDPSTKSTHSFDLQFRDDHWKICQSP